MEGRRILYSLPEGKYHATLIKVVAMAIHTEVISPEELSYMLSKMKQSEIANILYQRVLDKRDQD